MEDFSAHAFEGTRNDLESVVFARYAAVRDHFEWLDRRGNARMTGSGACVFAAYDGREEAQRVIDELPAGMNGFVAHGLSRHPLRT